jgi:O-antigen biosynthesis alpha-1,2-mannosyltransferase
MNSRQRSPDTRLPEVARILVDLQVAQVSDRSAGAAHYALQLVRAMAASAGEHEMFILLNASSPDSAESVLAELRDVLSADRCLLFSCPGPVANSHVVNASKRRIAEVLREHMIDSLSPDVLLVAGLTERSAGNVVTSIGHHHSSVLQGVVVFEPMGGPEASQDAAWLGPIHALHSDRLRSLLSADFLLAASERVRQETIRLQAVDPERIASLSPTADLFLPDGGADPAAICELRRRLGLSQDVLLVADDCGGGADFEPVMRAYATLPLALRSQHQLVIACEVTESQRQELRRLAQSSGFEPGAVVLTGMLTDLDLAALLATCRLLILPAWQARRGLQSLQTLCWLAPTIGARTGDLRTAIGREDALFDPASIEDLGRVIHKALTDAGFHQSLRAGVVAPPARSGWSDIALRALEFIGSLVQQRSSGAMSGAQAGNRRRSLYDAIAGIDPPGLSDNELVELAEAIDTNDREVRRLQAHASFSGSLNWRLEGPPFDNSYSLALVNRETARALAKLGHCVALATETETERQPSREFLDLNPDLREMYVRASTLSPPEAAVQSRDNYPPRVADMRGRIRMLHNYAWEESRFPVPWVDEFNDHLDGLTCLSSHVRKVLVDNGVAVPMSTSGCGVDHWERVAANPAFEAPGRHFRFLHVSSCFPRKGVDVLLEAFGRAFTDDDDVSLVIKSFPNPHNTVHDMLAQYQRRNATFPHTVIIDQDMEECDLKALYGLCHVLVAPSRAEGYGLPLAEAMLSGLPVITTAWSGQLDFCDSGNSWLVDYSFRQTSSHFNLSNSVWAEPDVDDLVRAMREAFLAPSAVRLEKARVGRQLLLKEHTWVAVAERLVGFVGALRARASAPAPTRVGWITTWNTRCGIATYSGALLENLPVAATILAPYSSELLQEDPPNCIRSWKMGKEENGLDELSHKVVDERLDVLVIQFNYGFFNFRQFGQFLDEQIDAGRAIIVMMHRTIDAGLDPAWNYSLQTIKPMLARCSRVLVHSIADLNHMKGHGLTENVGLFPHGVPDSFKARPARPTGAVPIIATYGFCFPHKGILEVLDAARILRDAGSPIRLRLINSEYPVPESAELIREIGRRVDEFDLRDLVETNHGFLSDAESLEHLAAADLLVYAYQDTSESASGAVRHGLAIGVPVAVTPLSIFDDISGAVFRLPGISPADIARGVTDVLAEIRADSAAAREVAARSAQWRSDHGYSRLGRTLYSLCIAAARDIAPLRWGFAGSSRQLHSPVGRLVGRSVESTDRPGLLLSGPGIAVPLGTYRIRITGEYVVPAGDFASVEVRAARGNEKIVRANLVGQGSGGVVADLTISLYQPRRDLEVRVQVSHRVWMRIDSLSIDNCNPGL